MQGGEADIRAKHYSMAFQLKYDENANKLAWKIADYQLAGDEPYF